VLEARAAIPESQLFRVRPGDPARIRIEGLAAPIETTVAAVGDSIDLATRTYGVRMRVPNPERTLKAGVFAQVEIEPRALGDVTLVPRDAIRSEDGASRVFTVSDGVVASVPVTLGAISDQAVELLAGPPLGTPVIIGASTEQVTPGMHVRARPQQEPGA
jgi:multidrug efflux pump subunit AcrA (membrane-fusion protein)